MGLFVCGGDIPQILNKTDRFAVHQIARIKVAEFKGLDVLVFRFGQLSASGATGDGESDGATQREQEESGVQPRDGDRVRAAVPADEPADQTRARRTPAAGGRSVAQHLSPSAK